MEFARKSGTVMRPMLIIPQPILRLHEFTDDLLESLTSGDSTKVVKAENNNLCISKQNVEETIAENAIIPADADVEELSNSAMPAISSDVNNNKHVAKKKKRRHVYTLLKRRRKAAAVKRALEPEDCPVTEGPKEESAPLQIINYICLKCDGKFNNEDLLESHMESAHSIMELKPETTENEIVNEVQETTVSNNPEGEDIKPKEDVFPQLWILTEEEKQQILCSVCKKTFSRLSVLRIHKKRHFDPNIYRCDHCNKVFNSASTYRHHRAYSGLAPFKCTKCPKSFFMKSKCQDHIQQCEGKTLEKKYSCEICGRAYVMKCSLRTHIKERHTEFKPAKNLCCECCGKRFRHKKYLEAHMHSHSSERNFSCQLCSKAYKSNDILRNHIRMAHKGPQRVTCEICNKEVSRISLKNHLKRHRDKSEESKIYEEIIAHDENSPACRVCTKRFENEKHREMHFCLGIDDTFSCPDCAENYNTAEGLSAHFCPSKPQSSTSKTFECIFCYRQYNAHTPWLYHMRHHTGFKPYHCTECDKSFRLKQGLKVHMRNHTGEKPFQCHLCPAAFKQKPFLLDHINTHTGEKPYQCDRCTSRFSVRSALSIHKRIHRREIQLQRLPASSPN